MTTFDRFLVMYKNMPCDLIMNKSEFPKTFFTRSQSELFMGKRLQIKILENF